MALISRTLKEMNVCNLTSSSFEEIFDSGKFSSHFCNDLVLLCFASQPEVHTHLEINFAFYLQHPKLFLENKVLGFFFYAVFYFGVMNTTV